MRGRNYNVPNVPYVMYYSGGYALHGAYWHNRFGTPVSHGCVNLRTASARWLYNWAPVGTPVVVRR
jgi:lipoprotein-anchoring transpeptidase ErfK/SrfK